MAAMQTAVMSAPMRFPGPSGGGGGGGPTRLPTVSLSGGGQPFQPYYLRPAYRFKQNLNQPPGPANPPVSAMSMMADYEGGPGRRLRRNVTNVRRHIDYLSSVLNHTQSRLVSRPGLRDRAAVQPDPLFAGRIEPPASTKDAPIDCVLNKFMRAALNKIKCPIFAICWTPDGKRLITGASTGEFTLWNGTAFNFETILQAHDTAIRALRWAHNDQWLVSADHDGFVKYWQPNMNNVHMYQAHKEAIRCISFAPTDVKLATASDDGTARVWDFVRCVEERILRGHGSDVRSVDWHPQKGLLVTGSRDSQQPVKIWDPKTGQCLATLHDHKNSVMATQWNKNGNWLLTGSRDHLIKLYDIRMMREIKTFRGHKKEVTAVAWHPIHENLLVSGGGDGSLMYWLATSDKEVGLLEHAHDQSVWTLEWHPLGHILASGSNDNNTKFWARSRPGDTQDEFYGMAQAAGFDYAPEVARPPPSAPAAAPVDNGNGPAQLLSPGSKIPGMGLGADVLSHMSTNPSGVIPGLGGAVLLPDDPTSANQGFGARRTLIKQPPPKRAQRQFERMWNTAKPSGAPSDDPFGFDDDYGGRGDVDGGRPGKKASLLGPPPPDVDMDRALGPPPGPADWRDRPIEHWPAPPPMRDDRMYDERALPMRDDRMYDERPPMRDDRMMDDRPPMHDRQYLPPPPPSNFGFLAGVAPPPPAHLAPLPPQHLQAPPPMLDGGGGGFGLPSRSVQAPIQQLGPMWQIGQNQLPPPSSMGMAQFVPEMAPPPHSYGEQAMLPLAGDTDYRLREQRQPLGPSAGDVDLRALPPQASSWSAAPLQGADEDLRLGDSQRDPRVRKMYDQQGAANEQQRPRDPRRPAAADDDEDDDERGSFVNPKRKWIDDFEKEAHYGYPGERDGGRNYQDYRGNQ